MNAQNTYTYICFQLRNLRNDIVWGRKGSSVPGDKKPQNGSSGPLPALHDLSNSMPQSLYGM